MNKHIKRLLIFLGIVAVIVLLTFIIYPALQAFDRKEVSLSDSEYISRDGAIEFVIRDNNALLTTPENRTMFTIKIVDKNMAELSNSEIKTTAIFIDNGEMLYLLSERIYLKKIQP